MSAKVWHAVRVFEFDYRLTGRGWAEARVADDEVWVVVTASYLSDALRSLIEAVALTVEGIPEARCFWEEEPGEYRWIFSWNGDSVTLEIRAFDDLWDGQPDEAGRIIFQTEQDPIRIGRAVLSAAQAVLDQYGLEQYRKQWVEHPFPVESMVMALAEFPQVCLSKFPTCEAWSR